ncbi:MAG: hypothetical protein WCS73_01180 [Lentisphaeria bacterium]
MTFFTTYRNQKIKCIVIALLLCSMTPHLLWHIGRKALPLKAACINAMYPEHYMVSCNEKSSQDKLSFCPFAPGMLSLALCAGMMLLAELFFRKQFVLKYFKKVISKNIFYIYSRGPPAII